METLRDPFLLTLAAATVLRGLGAGIQSLRKLSDLSGRPVVLGTAFLVHPGVP